MNDVIIVQRIFPEYRKSIFDAIHKNVNFSLLHSKNDSGIKQTSSGYSVLIKKWQYGKGDTHLFLNLFGYIRKYKPNIIIHELAVGIISLPLVVLGKRFFGYKFILWGHTYNRKAGFYPDKKISDKYRLWLQRRADAIITYSLSEKEELVRHKIDSKKIFPAPNTLDTNKYLTVRNSFDQVGKRDIKQKVDFHHTFNLIFIGRLYEDKLPHYAIEVLDLLIEKGIESIALHFVGTGLFEARLKELASQRGLQDHIVFHGEIYDEQKTGALLYASDMMIMPGCVGLSVNHAFCFDCPVITFESISHVPAHGTEI
jgi:glycosyltransferase involved in cell wall biosynthesis